jgi:ABC-type bacteriocin/lantibiotic exporter with double-glycine peptidase domain
MPLRWMVTRRRCITPEVRQAEAAECGLAALAIILGYHGTHVTLEELRRLAGSTARGSSAFFLVALARRFGLVATFSREELETLADLGFPLIAHSRFIHFVVVEGINGEHVWINDPDGGPRTITEAEFNLDFTGIALSFAPGPSHRPRGRAFSWWRYLRARASGRRPLLLVAAGAALAAAFATLASVRLAAAAAGWALGEGGFGGIAVAAAAAALAAGVLGYCRDSSAARCAAAIAGDAVERSFRRLSRLPGRFFFDRQPSQIRAKLGAAITLGSQGAFLASVLGLSLPIVLGAGALAVDRHAGGVIAVSAGLDVLAVALLFGRRGGIAARLGAGAPPIVALSAEQIDQIDTYWVGGGEMDLYTMLAGRHADLAAPLQEAGAQYAALESARSFLSAIRWAGALGFAVLGVTRDYLTFGEAAALVMLAMLIDMPLGKFACYFRLSALKDAAGALADLDEVAVDPVEIGAYRSSPRSPGSHVEARAASWSVGPAQPAVLDGVSFALEPGGQLGICGPSGSGKTILTHLLVGIRQPSSGGLLIDGQPPTAWREGDAVLVTRACVVIDATLRSNLSLGAALPDDVLAAALREVRLWDELEPRGGLDLRLSRGGAELSGGQRSRLDMARAMLRRPRLIVVDGALDSVELALESEIRNAIRRRGTTLVLVSARAETLSACDRVLRLAACEPAVFGSP